MSRLIDADALIEFLDSERKSGLALHDFSMVGSYLNAIKYVENMPTAYDVEKVVAELEEMEEKAIKVKNVTVSSYACGMMHKAIDIVRKGGVE